MTLLTAVDKRERFSTLLADDGESTGFTAEITVAGVAPGTYLGRLYFKLCMTEAE